MYHLNLLEEQRSSAQRAWRKQINKVTNLIGDSTNIDLLKSERTFLETRMDILYAASNRLCEALADIKLRSKKGGGGAIRITGA